MENLENDVKDFEAARAEELQKIRELRKGAPPGESGTTTDGDQDLVGLAFSGGGIRSATFGLGVLEAMKEKGLLQAIDYLSTVSGGGYIGSWLSANCKRAHKRKEEPWLSPQADWTQSITHLRRYSNYLSPNLSLLSADTWSMVMIWLRNTLLLQLMIVMGIACLMLIPRLAVPLIDFGGKTPLLWIIAGAFTYLVVWIAGNLKSIKLTEEAGAESRLPLICRLVPELAKGQAAVQGNVILLMIVSLGFSALLWQNAEAGNGYWDSVAMIYNSDHSFWWFLLLPYLSMILLSVCSSRGSVFFSLLAAIPATAVLYLLLAFTLYWIGDWHSADWLANGGRFLAFAWAPPMVMVSFVLTINVLIGMQGSGSYEYVREWWSRFGAWLAIYSVAWMLVVVVAFYGPLLAEWVYFENIWQISSSGWLGTLLAGLFAGSSSSTDGGVGDSLGAKAKEMLAKAAPFVFIAGVLIAVATGVHLLVAYQDDDFTANRTNLIGEIALEETGKSQTSTPLGARVDASTSTDKVDKQDTSENPQQQTHWHLLAEGNKEHFWFSVWLFVVALFCMGLLSLRIDINEFSLNAFYRNRLARCYLGATRKPANRHPHTFTGFDRDDDLPLSELTTPRSPFHIVNCALNLGGSNDLSLHTRHSTVFTLTPLRCGSHYQIKKQSGEIISQIGYFETAKYGGRSPTLGQAVSVSGAAASPNMGYHTSAPVAFFMTIFNARLGWWFPNPSNTDCDKPSPPNSLSYLLKELFGIADEKQDFLAISDGGHFENLAAYELIKRQCRIVIISDGECDPQLHFEGLANLIRLAEVDRLAKIDIDVRSIQPKPDAAWSHRRCAIGRIRYSEFDENRDEKDDGWLIYIKASMSGLEDTAVLQYKATHPDFPHESTGDQFYAEDQFESYRNLGYTITKKLFGKLEVGQTVFAEDYMKKLADIFSAELSTKSEFTKHADSLMEIWDQFRADDRLLQLDDELFVPGEEGKPGREIFYKCSEMIQLMENVYLDLDLEETWEHPDNRGWKGLFIKWAQSPQMAKTWGQTKTTYGLRFRSFWDRCLVVTEDRKK